MKETVGSETQISPYTQALTRFVAASSGRLLSEAVATKGKLHLLDTLASMISGTALKPGQTAVKFGAREEGGGKASIVGTPHRVPCVTAAFVNAILAHSDETDDSHAASVTHPGCAVVPCALAFAEIHNRSGMDLLNAVVTGYEIAARINMALDPDALRARGFGPHSIGGTWGAGAAAGALSGFTDPQLRAVFSYVGQQTAGMNCWMRDRQHILKAFSFGGMPSRSGAFAAEMVANDFTGIDDILAGRGGFFFAFADNPRPEMISEGLGSEFRIMGTAIKKWTVGSPIQAPLDSLLALMKQHGIGPADVAKLRVRIADNLVRTVNNREMSDISLQHCLALMLVDGTVTFASSHDHERTHDPKVAAVRAVVEVIPDTELTAARPPRQAIVEVDTKDGRALSHRTYAVRGTPGDPMTTEEVAEKALDLTVPILGRARAEDFVKTVLAVDALEDANSLRKYWA